MAWASVARRHLNNLKMHWKDSTTNWGCKSWGTPSCSIYKNTVWRHRTRFAEARLPQRPFSLLADSMASVRIGSARLAPFFSKIVKEARPTHVHRFSTTALRYVNLTLVVLRRWFARTNIHFWNTGAPVPRRQVAVQSRHKSRRRFSTFLRYSLVICSIFQVHGCFHIYKHTDIANSRSMLSSPSRRRVVLGCLYSWKRVPRPSLKRPLIHYSNSVHRLQTQLGVTDWTNNLSRKAYMADPTEYHTSLKSSFVRLLKISFLVIR